MHFVSAKTILSAQNGMNLYRAALTAVFIATAEVPAIILPIRSRILQSSRMHRNFSNRHCVPNVGNA